MMNLQFAQPEPLHWAPSSRRSSPKPERDGRLASLQEVKTLLQYVGQLQDLSDMRQFQRRRLKAGQHALHMGQPFDGLYVVRVGALKTSMTQVDGGEHVLAFPMKGNLLGFDGMYKKQYLTEVVALTDCDLIKLPAKELFAHGWACNELERMAYSAISREVVQEQMAYALSHSAKSEARVARFLMIQSQRFAEMGYSPRRFTLPMTRRDIGNHLNVTLETVSRAFSSLDHLGVISVDRREIEILSMEALHAFES